MKAKMVLSVLVLALASVSFGDILMGDFEGGSTDGWWAGWPTSMTPIEEYATLGTGSMKVVMADGGWVEMIEIGGLLGTPMQTALGTIGQITLDATSFWNEAEGYSWGCQLAIIVNCTGLWNGFAYQDVIVNGATQSFTFQLPEDVMATIAAITSETENPYVNIGILSNTAGNVWSEPDPITGETTLLFQGGATHYLDNIQIVPEPATLSMLGLGALALLRKKR